MDAFYLGIGRVRSCPFLKSDADDGIKQVSIFAFDICRNASAANTHASWLR